MNEADAGAGVRGLNHLTLAVADVERSVRFYRDVLGFRLRAQWSEGAYLEAGALWLCLSQDPMVRTAPHPDYTHVALTVDDVAYEELTARVTSAASIWKENRSEGRSLYVLDPDKHKLELHVGTLETRLDDYRARPVPGRVICDRASSQLAPHSGAAQPNPEPV